MDTIISLLKTLRVIWEISKGLKMTHVTLIDLPRPLLAICHGSTQVVHESTCQFDTSMGHDRNP